MWLRILLTTATFFSRPREYWASVSMLEDEQRPAPRPRISRTPPREPKPNRRWRATWQFVARLASRILPAFVRTDSPIRMPPPPYRDGIAYWPCEEPLSDDDVATQILTVPQHYATKTIANGGGNWSADASWVEGAHAIAGDAVVATATSGQMTIDVASACASMILTGYVNTMTFNSTLTMTSTCTFVSGMTIAGTAGTLIMNTGTLTMTSAGKTLTCALTYGASATYTMADTWTVNGLVTAGVTTGTTTINSGANVLICAGGFHEAGTTASIAGTGTLQLGGGTWDRSGTQSLSKSVNLQGNVTISGTVRLDAVTLTYTSGTLTVAGSTISFNTAPCTLNTAGTTLNIVQFGVAGTYTLNSLLSAAQVTLPDGAITFAGTAGFTVATLTNVSYSSSRIVTLHFGNTYTVTSSLHNVGALLGVTQSFISSSAGNKVVFILLPGATQDLIFANATDIDSSMGQTIVSFRGVITTSNNWINTLVLPHKVGFGPGGKQ